MNGFSNAEATIVQTLMGLQKQLAEINEKVAGLQDLECLPGEIEELKEVLHSVSSQKDFYSTQEVADLMGVSPFTVQTRWCAEGRIECEKDPKTRRWRIPGTEYERLRLSGTVAPQC